ncbi:MAG: hypothetical protein ACXW6T_23425, partial [Candidatus Binatia bacterium]
KLGLRARRNPLVAKTMTTGAKWVAINGAMRNRCATGVSTWPIANMTLKAHSSVASQLAGALMPWNCDIRV